MPNIRVDLDYTIHDGSELKFRSPVDCSAITGLIVYYPGADGNTTSKEFALADAHGNNVGDIDHLFAEDVVVKVILDVTKGMAFVQNADTNAYLEQHIQSKSNPHGVTAEQVGARPNDWMPTAAQVGAAPSSHLNDKNNPHGVTIAQIGAAPAGYGLGTPCQSIGSWNDALVNGYYKSNGDAPDGYWWWGEVIAYADNSSIIQRVMRWVDGKLTQMWRSGSKDAWSSWTKDIVSESDVQTLVNNGKSKFVKLWQNAALGSTFNAQDISLGDISQYDLFVFRFRYRTSESRVFSVVMMPIELYNSNVCLYIPGGQWDGGNTLHSVHRYVWMHRDSGSLGFYSAYKDGTTGENSYCIPDVIYGIKL